MTKQGFHPRLWKGYPQHSWLDLGSDIITHDADYGPRFLLICRDPLALADPGIATHRCHIAHMPSQMICAFEGIGIQWSDLPETLLASLLSALLSIRK